jgi:TRAP transporter TAXI family solute receptor
MVVLLAASLLMAACTPQQAASPTTPAPATKPAYQMPDPVIFTSLDVGSAGYIIAASIADAIKQKQGTTVRVVPSGTDVGRLSLLTSGRAHVAFWAVGPWLAQEGVMDYAVPEGGPQTLRQIWGGKGTQGSCWVTTKSSNIKTMADIKGKKVVWIVGSPTLDLMSRSLLAFAGLTVDDIVKVEAASAGAGTRLLLDGKADAIASSTNAAFCYQLESTPQGVYFPPMPNNDNDAWARLLSTMPGLIKTKATEGPGLSEANPVDSAFMPNPTVVCVDKTSVDLVYQLTKTMAELYPVYSASKAPGIGQFDVANLVLESSIPWHDGAIKYFKEIGKWTPAAQQAQDVLLARQKVLMDAWDKTSAEAAAQKVTLANFPALWMKNRNAGLEAAKMASFFK